MSYNTPANSIKAKRIGIDARFYGPIGKGLGRYTQEIVDNITEIDQHNQYVIFLRRENFNSFDCDGQRVKKILADVNWYGLAEQTVMPYLIRREHLDLMHFPHFNVPLFCPVKFIATIHDLILIKFPTKRATTLGPFLYKIKNLAYLITVSQAIRRSVKILAVSDFTKNEIAGYFNLRADKIITTYEGVATPVIGQPNRSKALDGKYLEKKYKIIKPYLLYVGNAYPHKNLEGLLEIFSSFRKKYKNLKLVLVGRDDYFYLRIKKFAFKLNLWNNGDNNSSVIFPGYVPDSDLRIYYQQALAYIFPSRYEGFGLPPLEAMANGCPVLSSDKTCLKEILADAAWYFNPDQPERLTEQLERLINNQILRQELIKKGLDQVKKYSWKKCADETLKIYNEALSNPNELT